MAGEDTGLMAIDVPAGPGSGHHELQDLHGGVGEEPSQGHRPLDNPDPEPNHRQHCIAVTDLRRPLRQHPLRHRFRRCCRNRRPQGPRPSQSVRHRTRPVRPRLHPVLPHWHLHLEGVRLRHQPVHQHPYVFVFPAGQCVCHHAGL